MKRLLDPGSSEATPSPRGDRLGDDEARELRGLFRGVEPVGDLSAMEARVRARLPASPPPAGSVGSWGGAAMIGALLGAALVAAVLWTGKPWRSAAPDRPSPAASVTEVPLPARDSPAAPAAPAPATVPQGPPATSTAPTARRAAHSRARSRDPAAAVASCDREPLDTAVVVDAVAALRRDQDPDRALLLLDYYLKKRPDGALAEEAMALSIEAAVRRDQGGALTRAYKYLGHYPSGRYASYARSVTESAGRDTGREMEWLK